MLTRYPHPCLPNLDFDRRLGARRYAVRRSALHRRDQHLGEPGRIAQFLPPAIDLARRNIGAPRHVGNHRPRRKTLGDDRSLLILAPPAPTLGAGDHLKSRHRTAASTNASTVICTSATTCLHPAMAQGDRKSTRL